MLIPPDFFIDDVDWNSKFASVKTVQDPPKKIGLFHCSICSQRVFARTHWNNCEPRPSTNQPNAFLVDPTCCRTEVLGSTVLLRAAVCSPLFPFFGCACRCCCCCCCCCLGCCGWAYCCCMYCCCCCFPFLPFPLPSSFPLPHTHCPQAPEATYVSQSFQAKEKDLFLAEQGL